MIKINFLLVQAVTVEATVDMEDMGADMVDMEVRQKT